MLLAQSRSIVSQKRANMEKHFFISDGKTVMISILLCRETLMLRRYSLLDHV